MATDLSTIQTRIDQIDTILAGGMRSISTGTDRMEYDLQALKDERAHLQRIVSASSSSSFRRVVFKSG